MTDRKTRIGIKKPGPPANIDIISSVSFPGLQRNDKSLKRDIIFVVAKNSQAIGKIAVFGFAPENLFNQQHYEMFFDANLQWDILATIDEMLLYFRFLETATLATIKTRQQFYLDRMNKIKEESDELGKLLVFVAQVCNFQMFKTETKTDETIPAENVRLVSS